MTVDIAPAPAYQATLERVSWRDLRAHGRVVLRGPDRADLLNRLSTNNIVTLQPGQGTRTVLTNPIGRIIDLLTVLALPDRLLLLGTPGHGAALVRFLRKNIFFNDKAEAEDLTHATCQFAIYGPGAAALLGSLAPDASLADLPRFHVRELRLAGQPVHVVRDLPLGGDGLTLVADAALAPVLPALLDEAGALALDDASYEALRVEQGYAASGRELSLEYIPLETGLADAISFKKGCYVGQEIIARMESRNRLAKRLMGLRLSAPLDAPAKLAFEGKEMGDLTSAVVSPRFGPIALAYVRTAQARPGARLAIADSDVTAEVVELPFC
jgi:tRNA-modifying protein YgfZ